KPGSGRVETKESRPTGAAFFFAAPHRSMLPLHRAARNEPPPSPALLPRPSPDLYLTPEVPMQFLMNPWPWWFSGPLIGLTVGLLLVLGGRNLGVSSSFRHLCSL